MTDTTRLFSEKPHRAYLDKGHVVLLDSMGTDADVEYAARMSYAEGTRTVSDTKNLIDYLLRHHHTTPFEMVEFKFQIKMPIFIMRQLVRHRTASINEMSMRYSVLPDQDMYIPTEDRLNPQSASNKQCSANEMLENGAALIDSIMESSKGTFDVYQELLGEGLARETARIVLPVNTYTEIVWKLNLKNLMHFLKLRDHPHAQKEIQWLAQALYELVKETNTVNLSLDAYERYIKNAHTFSQPQMEILSLIAQAHFGKGTPPDLPGVIASIMAKMGKREQAEFMTALGVN